MKPNIVFLLLDSFRSDKCYGESKTSKTPNLDTLIKNSTYLPNTFASADGTILSLNSLFTGLFPFKTGTRAKKLQLHGTNFIDILKKNGYHIYGKTPYLTSFSSLYDYFENEDAHKPPNLNGSVLVEYEGTNQEIDNEQKQKDKKILGEKSFAGGEILSGGLDQEIIDMLVSNNMKEPWFLYIHMLDLHWPHVVPSEFNSENFGHSLYERIVSAIDSWLGKFIEKIDMSTTLLVLTGDHGHVIPVDNKDITTFEPDLELGLKAGKHIMPKSTHTAGAKFFVGLRSIIRDAKLVKANRNLTPYEKRSRLPPFTLSLFDESIRVPLVFSGYGTSSKIIYQQVRNVDIFPTIFELIDLSSGEFPRHGRSLLPLLSGKKTEELPAYIQSIPYEKISPDDIVGVRTSHLKYFRATRDSKKNVNLYDLTKDTRENFNIAKECPDLVNKMEHLLTEITTDDLPEYNIEEMTKKEKKEINDELRRLGYV